MSIPSIGLNINCRSNCSECLPRQCNCDCCCCKSRAADSPRGAISSVGPASQVMRDNIDEKIAIVAKKIGETSVLASHP